MTPTERTLKALRSLGYTAAVVEKWNKFGRVRQDLFGFLDVIALADGQTIGIQCTSGSNVAARRAKILGLETPVEWLECGNYIEIWGWKKYSKPINGRWWRPRIEAVTLYDFHGR